MTIYDRPFDPNRPLSRSGCICGRHRSQPEHDHETARTMMCEPVAAQISGSEDREPATVDLIPIDHDQPLIGPAA